MIIVRNLALDPEEKQSALKAKAAKKLRVPETAIREIKLVKRSLDARKKSDIHYNCSVALALDGEGRILKRSAGRDIGLYKIAPYTIPPYTGSDRPVVVGFGPGGMFAALVLARAGAKPLVIERGQEAALRQKAVDEFRRGGKLNTESNVQFGEGGAGTFSDGKLNTGTHDFRMSWMLREFYLHGAPESVTYEAKPHIGTDILIDLVQNIRREIIALGGEVRFETKLIGLRSQDGQLTGAELLCHGEKLSLPCSQLILATGHSARDTFELLKDEGIVLEQKPFSMGLRIEHLQMDIDMAQYGRARGALPPADYSLNVRLPDGSSAYTFCMCPGGKVFAAASEENSVVTNGMSYSQRDGENANAALLVTLRPEDFPSDDPLSGMYWQREIEQGAYRYSGSYRAPAQLVGDFLACRPSTGAGRVTPSYEPGVVWGELHKVLPEQLSSVIERAIPELGKKLRGFDDDEAVLTGVETRSSSPVRILRDGTLQASLKGLYPCGEGAGYAGGISSAAIDGMRCAEAVIARWQDLPPEHNDINPTFTKIQEE